MGIDYLFLKCGHDEEGIGCLLLRYGMVLFRFILFTEESHCNIYLKAKFELQRQNKRSIPTHILNHTHKRTQTYQATNPLSLCNVRSSLQIADRKFDGISDIGLLSFPVYGFEHKICRQPS